jgi:hypothetical protein
MQEMQWEYRNGHGKQRDFAGVRGGFIVLTSPGAIWWEKLSKAMGVN